MNSKPCNNCVGNFSIFPTDETRWIPGTKKLGSLINKKPNKTSSSLYTNNKSSYIVANIWGYGRTSSSKAVWGPGDWINPTKRNATPSIITGGGVDMKHGGYFRYIMRKRGMAIGGTTTTIVNGKRTYTHKKGCGCN